MNERTVMILVWLSHGGSLFVLLVVIMLVIVNALVRKNLQRARLRGDSDEPPLGSVIGRIMGTLLAVSVGVLLISFSHYGCAILMGRRSTCLSNVKALSTSAAMYAQDYDERLPPSNTWFEAVASRVREGLATSSTSDRDPFRCPASESPWSYGMNMELGGVSESEIDYPAATALFFDADASSRSYVGGAGDVARTRHNYAPSIGFADGHARNMVRSTLDRVVWNPKIGEGKPPL